MCTAVAAVVGGSAVYNAYTQKQSANMQAENADMQGKAAEKISEYNATATEYTSEYNASIAEFNAGIYEAAAEDARRRGVQDAFTERQKGKQAISTGRAVMGSSGFKVDSGTNAQIQVQNKGVTELNALTILSNSNREAKSLDTAAINQRAEAAGIRYTGALEASGMRMQGKLSMITSGYNASSYRYAGNLGAAGALINGASTYTVSRLK